LKELNLESLDRQPVSDISILELKSLLVTITDNRLKVYFRYRLLGEMWQTNFVRVVKVTDNGVVLHDKIKNKTISLSDLKMIIQFELDGSLYAFEPNFHYNVVNDHLNGNPYAKS
jgi:hypothetical protein